MSMIGSWLVLSLAVFVTAEVLPGFKVKGVKGTLAVAAVLGLVFLQRALPRKEGAGAARPEPA